jgi:hypothetical protein
LGTPSFDGKKLLYECKISWNIIMKGIEILFKKGFGIVCVCEIHGRRMV